MFPVNHVELQGIAETGIETHAYKSGNGEWCSFVIKIEAASEKAKDQYFEIKCFTDKAVSKARSSIQKGVPVRVEGSLSSGSYQMANGDKKLTCSINAIFITVDTSYYQEAEKPKQEANYGGISDDMFPF